MDLIGLAVVVALAVVGFRAVKRMLARRRWSALRDETPGYSADRPALLTSARVVDELVAAARCSCGGRVRNCGETSRLGLRVVRGRCEDCDGDVELYFVLPTLLN